MVVRSVSSAVCTGGQARRGRSGSVARAASASPQRRASVARRGSTAQAPASSPAAASSPVKALALDAKHAAQAEAERPQRPFRKVLGKLLAFLDQTWLQTLQYIVFLIAFQSLTGTIRKVHARPRFAPPRLVSTAPTRLSHTNPLTNHAPPGLPLRPPRAPPLSARRVLL